MQQKLLEMLSSMSPEVWSTMVQKAVVEGYWIALAVIILQMLLFGNISTAFRDYKRTGNVRTSTSFAIIVLPMAIFYLAGEAIQYIFHPEHVVVLKLIELIK